VKGAEVIVRTWKGATRDVDADRYIEYMQQTGLKEYRQTTGNLGAFILHRPAGDKAEFIFVSFWDSIDAVRRFAGEGHERAVFYPQDDDFLIDRDLHVDHYNLAGGDVPFEPR
jgi:hypothetical protein